MTIKELLDSLPPEDRARLNYGFEHQLAQFAILPDGRYIGVHTKTIAYLKPEAEVGVWAVGVVPNVPKTN